MDGSGYNGHIGTAIYSPTSSITKGKYIGTDNTHNVYAATIQMAVTLFKEKIDEYIPFQTIKLQSKPSNNQNVSLDSILWRKFRNN